MRELAVPPLSSSSAVGGSVTDAVFRHAVATPDAVLLRRLVGRSWVDVPAREFADQVQAVAAGLLAAGLEAGDRVGLMSKTRYEWTLCDYAIWTAGAVTVPIYETSSAEQVAWILGDSGAVAVIVETAAHAAVVDQVRDSLPDLRELWALESGAVDALTSAGAGADLAALEARRAAVGPDDLATIIYTSGTTGRPKGCELTHGNLVWSVAAAGDPLSELFTPGSSTLLFLPLAHVFARIIQVSCLSRAVPMGHTADLAGLAGHLASFSPTFVLSVPRVFEKVYNGAAAKAAAAGRQRVFALAEATAVAYSEALQSRSGRVPVGLRARHAVFDRLVYSKLRAALGGRVRHAVSGGAPLGARLGHFFRGAGVTVLEGYGLTETTACGTVNSVGALRVGSVGRPIPGSAVRIADDGEILLRGGNVFRGYWRNPSATAEVFDEEGWFRSGDLGALDDDGFLTITGRAKEIIVTAGGKNVAPAVLEDRLRAHPLVSQCMVVGDARPFIAALITLDVEAVPAWASSRGRPSTDVAALADDPELQREIGEAVAKANEAVSRAEAIREFRVLSVDFTEAGGQLTPSLKLKRSVVLEQFGAEVEALYAR